MRAALAVMAILVAPDVASAICAAPWVGSAVLTIDGAKLAADGGVLVMASVSFEGTAFGAANAKNPSWRFSDGTKLHEPTLVLLAPGLVAYRPPAGAAGALTLVDGRATRATITLTGDTVTTLAAPEPAQLVVNTIPMRWGGSVLKVDATFKSAAPEGTVAVVVYGVTKKGNVARSWMQISAGSLTGPVAGSSGRCNPGVPGEIVSKAGDKVVLAWVDSHGRLSNFSKPVTVKKGK